jgi:rod shape-determining protein MreD
VIAAPLLRWIVVLAVGIILQVGLMPYLQIYGVVPDVMVVIAVCAGLSGGPQRGAVIGFWAGFLYDLPRDHPLGLTALAYCLVAFAAGAAQTVVLQSGRLISMAIVGVASALAALVFATEAELFGQHTLTNPRLVPIIMMIGLFGTLTSRIGLRVTGWADGPESRSVAE